MTKTFDEVISGVRTAKKGVEVREDLAQMGEYCKQFTDEAGQKANAARDEAKGYAAAAKASEKKATDAVAGIEQTKTDAVQAVQNAQTTATNAVQQAQSTATTAVTTKQTEAVQAVGTAQTGAVKAVDDERDAALQQVANSTKTAQTAASNAAASEQAAQASKEAAATSAGAAESSATAASGSASAAATSESNANQSAENSEASASRSEAAAKKAEAVVGTDKTLTISGAPADAKAVGDYILDAEGNVIFYSKAAVDELLAGKLDLTGGTMTGELALTHEGTFYPITSDNNGDTDNFIVTSNTAKGRKLGFGIGLGRWQGVFDFISGKYIINSDTETGEVFVDGQLFKGAIVASGSNYVRFGDGTQICWELGTYVDGYATETNKRVTFQVPFTNSPAILTTANVNAGSDTIISIGWESATAFSIGANGSDRRGITSWIAIGRWK